MEDRRERRSLSSMRIASSVPILYKEIKIEKDSTNILDKDFKMTFEDMKPIVKLERVENQENVGLTNGSGFQSASQTKKRGQKRKRV